MYALLRVALSSGPGEEPHLGVLTPEEWRALLTLAREQTVTGLVYDALRRPQYACFVPEEISLPLMLEAEKIERRSKKVRGVADELLSGLSAAGLYPIIFKGPSIAALYPVPELRISGDIDLYVPPTEADAAVEWLCGHGAMVSSSPDGALLSRMGGIDIDLHTRYFDLAEDMIGESAKGRQLKEISTEYSSEIKIGESMELKWGNEDDLYYLEGNTERRVFRMSLKY